MRDWRVGCDIRGEVGRSQFTVTIVEATTAQEQAIIKETKWALKYGKRYDDIDTMMDEVSLRNK